MQFTRVSVVKGKNIRMIGLNEYNTPLGVDDLGYWYIARGDQWTEGLDGNGNHMRTPLPR